MAFNNCDSNSNGELAFYNRIQGRITTIFDVGSRSDTEYLNFSGEVHYFEPCDQFNEDLKKKPTNNSRSFYNNYGLGNQEGMFYYYPKHQSFIDRKVSLVSDEQNKIELLLRTGKQYMLQNRMKHVDFLKIDTEGFELKVLQGFQDLLTCVDVIQFEYGGTYMDSNVRLAVIVDYLKERGFSHFSYLIPQGLEKIENFTDHYNYCNIVCVNNRCLEKYKDVFM